MLKRYKLHNLKYGEWDILRFALHDYRMTWFDELFKKQDDKSFWGTIDKKVCYRMVKVVDKLLKKVEAQYPDLPGRSG